MKNLVAKFGGSSLKDLSALRRCTRIVNSNPETKVVVLSAVKGVTNKLVEICDLVKAENKQEAYLQLDSLLNFHLDFVRPLESFFLQESLTCLFLEAKQMVRANHLFENHLAVADSLLAIGERASSLIFYTILSEQRDDVSYLDARSIIATDSEHSQAHANVELIEEQMTSLLKDECQDLIYITQGFIGSNAAKQTTTLGRDGSDYSAALFAEAIAAAALQIWTDVPGLASSDPRYVKETKIIAEINYEKAELLSKLGANILHPKTLAPAKRKNIPVFVGSSIQPELEGTWIKEQTDQKIAIAGVAQKKDYIKISITSEHEENFHEQIDSLLAKYEDLSPCHAFNGLTSAQIILCQNLKTTQLVEELTSLGKVSTSSRMENLSLVGDEIESNKKILDLVHHVQKAGNVDFLHKGKGHLSLLVSENHGIEMMNALHEHVFLQYGG